MSMINGVHQTVRSFVVISTLSFLAACGSGRGSSGEEPVAEPASPPVVYSIKAQETEASPYQLINFALTGFGSEYEIKMKVDGYESDNFSMSEVTLGTVVAPNLDQLIAVTPGKDSITVRLIAVEGSNRAESGPIVLKKDTWLPSELPVGSAAIAYLSAVRLNLYSLFTASELDIKGDADILALRTWAADAMLLLDTQISAIQSLQDGKESAKVTVSFSTGQNVQYPLTVEDAESLDKYALEITRYQQIILNSSPSALISKTSIAVINKVQYDACGQLVKMVALPDGREITYEDWAFVTNVQQSAKIDAMRLYAQSGAEIGALGVGVAAALSTGGLGAVQGYAETTKIFSYVANTISLMAKLKLANSTGSISGIDITSEMTDLLGTALAGKILKKPYEALEKYSGVVLGNLGKPEYAIVFEILDKKFGVKELLGKIGIDDAVAGGTIASLTSALQNIKQLVEPAPADVCSWTLQAGPTSRINTNGTVEFFYTVTGSDGFFMSGSAIGSTTFSIPAGAPGVVDVVSAEVPAWRQQKAGSFTW